MVDAGMLFRVLHIAFAILWAGGGLYRGIVVGAVERHGTEGARFRDAFYSHSFHGPFMGATSGSTVLFGYLAFFNRPEGAYLGSQMAVLGIGMLAATLAFGVGAFGHVRAERALRPLARASLAGEPVDQARYAQLVLREKRLGIASGALLGIALVTMVTFRLFPA